MKAYCQQQWTQILLGKVSAQDFIYAKEVKLGKYRYAALLARRVSLTGGLSDRVNPPPGAALAARKMKADSRAEPEYGERVPYILFNHGRGETQVNKAVSPEEFLADRCVAMRGSDLLLSTRTAGCGLTRSTTSSHALSHPSSASLTFSARTSSYGTRRCPRSIDSSGRVETKAPPRCSWTSTLSPTAASPATGSTAEPTVRDPTLL